MSEPAIFNDIRNALAQHDVVLFMKGSPQAPQCGFSATVVKILDVLDVDFASVNVLASNDVRDGIKAFSDWPTIPQLYVKGEFIGGCDIVKEMYATGELKELLTEKGVQFAI
ncbi:MAG: Grx4 family monothiol glutaredoxin [Caulobacterales bacterium]